MRDGMLAVVLGLLTVLPGQAAPVPKPGGAKLRSVTYDVADLLHRTHGKTGYDSIDQLIKVIVTTVDPEAWGPKSGESIKDLDGTRLEVRTTAARHVEVKTLLDALRGKMDLNVVLSAEVWEIDRATLAKEVTLPEGKKLAVALDVGAGVRLRKAAATAKANVVTLAVGKEGLLFARRKAFTYVTGRVGGTKGKKVYGVGMAGVTFRASAVVSPDRRFVRLRITRRVTELVELTKRTRFDPVSEDEYTIEVPDMVQSSRTSSITVGDGVPLLLRLPPPPGAGKADKRVSVLVVTPIIHIEEEEKVKAKEAPGS